MKDVILTMWNRLLVIALLTLAPQAIAQHYTIKAGSTDVTIYVALTDGGHIGGAADFEETNVQYVRNRSAAVSNSLVDLGSANASHTDWGFSNVINGMVRVDLPDAAVATGADKVVVTVKHLDGHMGSATIDIVGFDPTDGSRLGLMCMPNAAPNSTNGLVTYGTGTGQLNITGGNVRVVDGTGTGEIDTSSGRVGLHASDLETVRRAGGIVHVEEIEVVNTQTEFELANGIANDAELVNCSVVIYSATGDHWGTSRLGQSTETVIALEDPMPFTIAQGDTVYFVLSPAILAEGSRKARLALPNITPGNAGGLLTRGTSSGQIEPNGGNVRIVDGTGTGEIDTSSGKVTLNSSDQALIGAATRFMLQDNVDGYDLDNDGPYINLVNGGSDPLQFIGCTVVVWDGTTSENNFGSAIVAAKQGSTESRLYLDRSLPFTPPADALVRIYLPEIHAVDARFRVTSALPTAAPNAAGGLSTVGTGAGQINPSSGKLDLVDGAVDANVVADGAIDSGAIAGDAIGSSQLADGAIDAGAFAANAITAAKLAADVAIELQSGLPLQSYFEALFDGAPTFAEAMDEQGYTEARAEKIDRLAPALLLSTTIDGAPSSQTTFVLATGPSENRALNGSLVIITDGSDPSKKAVGLVKSYIGSTQTVTLVTDPGIFTISGEDQVDVIATGASVPLWLAP